MSQRTQALLVAHDVACNAQGVTITYYHDGVAIPDVIALPGKTDHETFDKVGLATNVEIQDWIVRADRLMVDDVQITPKRGDSLVLVYEGVTTHFAVHHPDGNRAPFKRCDAHGVLLRIHSMVIEPDPAPED